MEEVLDGGTLRVGRVGRVEWAEPNAPGQVGRTKRTEGTRVGQTEWAVPSGPTTGVVEHRKCAGISKYDCVVRSVTGFEAGSGAGSDAGSGRDQEGQADGADANGPI